MRILIFSDNHRNRENIKMMIDEHPKVDRMISLGDSEMSEIELSNLGIFGVKGNYPFEPQFPLDLFFDFEGWKFFLTHGHLYSVKNGISRIYEVGKEKEADIVCFGHTHRPLLEDYGDLILFNPGSLAHPKGSIYPTYGFIEVTEKELALQLIDLYSHVPIQTLIKKRR